MAIADQKPSGGLQRISQKTRGSIVQEPVGSYLGAPPDATEKHRWHNKKQAKGDPKGFLALERAASVADQSTAKCSNLR